MAKKINFTVVSDVNRAHAALLDFHVEHVLVSYPEHTVRNRVQNAKQYIVVLNRFKQDALDAFSKAGIRPSHIKNARHYEKIAKNHKRYGK